MPHPPSSLVRQAIQESMQAKANMLDMADQVSAAGDILIEALARGGTIFFVGNGGSAADCQHLAAELVGRFEKRVNRLSALALTTDTSILTALSNDFHFEEVFSRQVQALVRPGDALVALSTSGNSASILAAVRQARLQGASTVGLTGRDGGELLSLCDCCLVVPSQRTCRIQECHITLGHILCELLEQATVDGRIPTRKEDLL